MAKSDHTEETVRKAIAAGHLSPVYLLYGEEEFLMEELANVIVAAALPPDQRGFNLDVVYGSEADARDIVSFASSFPMMAERRVVVVREFDKLHNRELLTSYLEQPSATTCLILLATKPDFRRKPYVTAKRAGPVVEFKPLFENQVPSWIERKIRAQGKRIDPEAARMLAAYKGTSLREIQNEIEKLLVYCGEKKEITTDDVGSAVGMSREFNVFELQKALGAKDLRRSMEITEHMLEAGESATKIIIMLTRYFVVLWKLTALRQRGATPQEQAAAAGINPYFVKEYQSALELYTVPEIEHAFELLASADEELKTTSHDPKTVMQRLVVEIQQQKELAYS